MDKEVYWLTLQNIRVLVKKHHEMLLGESTVHGFDKVQLDINCDIGLITTDLNPEQTRLFMDLYFDELATQKMLQIQAIFRMKLNKNKTFCN